MRAIIFAPKCDIALYKTKNTIMIMNIWIVIKASYDKVDNLDNNSSNGNGDYIM